MKSAGSFDSTGMSKRAGTQSLPTTETPDGSRVLIGIPTRSRPTFVPWSRWYRWTPRATPDTNASLRVPPIVRAAFLVAARGSVMVSRWIDNERPVMIGERGLGAGVRSRPADATISVVGVERADGVGHDLANPDHGIAGQAAQDAGLTPTLVVEGIDEADQGVHDIGRGRFGHGAPVALRDRGRTTRA